MGCFEGWIEGRVGGGWGSILGQSGLGSKTGHGRLGVPEQVGASCVAQATASVVTYPHEVLRSHMHVEGSSQPAQHAAHASPGARAQLSVPPLPVTG